MYVLTGTTGTTSLCRELKMKLESTQMWHDGGSKVVPRLLVNKLSYGPVEENLKTFLFWVGDDS